MKDAAFSLTEAKFVTGEFKQEVLQKVTKAQCKVRDKKDNVAGVNIPIFELYQDGKDANEHIGLGRGGQKLTSMKQYYSKVSGYPNSCESQIAIPPPLYSHLTNR